MSGSYFIRRGGKIAGPRSSDDIVRLIAAGRLSRDDEVAASQNGPWSRIANVQPLIDKAKEQSIKPSGVKPQGPSGTPRSTSAPPPPGPRNSSAPPKPPIGNAWGSDQWKEPDSSIVEFGKKIVGGAFSGGKERLAAAYAEATSRFEESETIIIGDRVVFGRDAQKVDKVLPHPQVSLRHAVVRKEQGLVQIADFGSDAGTFVDGRRITKPTTLHPGNRVSLGPYSMMFDGENLVSKSVIDNAELICLNLTKTVTDRNSGQRINILDRVTLVAEPREFLVLLGPSGSGKSTLMNALSARSLASSGDVVLNGQNLYANFDAMKKSIALVPQKDVLHDRLRLQNALKYTARLRLPPDLSEQEIEVITQEYLDKVDLGFRSGTPIHALSGGQIKRASVANEIISQPNLLFIDEATSGLDEHTDGEIMQIFRKLAEDGKTVVCITHNLTNVEKFCHKVAIMAPGGFLAFVGTPAEARDYFGISTIGDIYARLKDQSGEKWRADFEATAVCQRMYAAAEQKAGGNRPDITQRAKPSVLQRVGGFARQSLILLRRGIELLTADVNSLIMLVGQCLLIAALIVMLFGDASLDGEENIYEAFHATQAILFLLCVSSFWFGCNNAAKEIVKEKTIFERERAVGLNIFSYYLSKFAILAGLTSIQITVLFAVVAFATELEGPLYAFYPALVLNGVCGVSLGLVISAWASNTDVAATAVPIAVIPQVILAGMIGEISGAAEWISSTFVTCFWTFGGVCEQIPDSVITSSQDAFPGEAPDEFPNAPGELFQPPSPLEHREETVANESYVFSIGVVAAHAVLLNSAAIAYLYVIGRRWIPRAAELEAWLGATRDVFTLGGRAQPSQTPNVSPRPQAASPSPATPPPPVKPPAPQAGESSGPKW